MTGDVVRDILTMNAAKCVQLDIMEWDVEENVARTVLTTNLVTMSVESVLMVARMGILAYTVTVLAPKEFTVKIVRRCVLLTVKHAEIQMDFALVRQAGWAQIALRNV